MVDVDRSSSRRSVTCSSLTRDARTWQITTLAILLVWNITHVSIGAALWPSLIAIATALAVQVLATRCIRRSPVDLRSPLITGLSLALLLRGDTLWVPAVAAAFAIGSKFLIRVRGKHLFNPAALAIFVLLQTGHAWVSPGQWGHPVVIGSAAAALAILVLTRAERLDLALGFGAAYAGLAFARAAWLGDPYAIPLHQIENGALLLFAFFMITDPRTTPDARVSRLVFAILLAVTAHWLLFIENSRSGLYVALVVASLVVPLLDALFPSARFAWRQPEVAREL